MEKMLTFKQNRGGLVTRFLAISQPIKAKSAR